MDHGFNYIKGFVVIPNSEKEVRQVVANFGEPAMGFAAGLGGLAVLMEESKARPNQFMGSGEESGTLCVSSIHSAVTFRPGGNRLVH